MSYTITDAESLADKIAGLELTGAEAAALGDLITRASGDDVQGYLGNFEIQDLMKPDPKVLRGGITRGLGLDTGTSDGFMKLGDIKGE